MPRTLILTLLACSSAFAQPPGDHIFIATAASSAFQVGSPATVQGAPYSATITNESIQTLADGNRIVQSSTGTTARDSMGRTRQDAQLPSIGNLRPAEAPRLVFIQDPVAQTSYTLNLTDKTATKPPPPMVLSITGPGAMAGATASGVFSAHMKGAAGAVAGLPMPGMQAQTFTVSRFFNAEGSPKPQIEDLGSQTMEGVAVTGVRTTMTIPAGEIGNDKPLSIVTEVWTSPELKTVVYSKRSDPRMGDQTFKLTNIVRSEPDPGLFSIPADFKVNEDPQPILYKTTGTPAP